MHDEFREKGMNMLFEENALTVTELSKSYGTFIVTNEISFNLGKGEALGIIGPNGAGKTTLFNLISGTTNSDKGSIQYFGQDITKVSARQRCHLGITRSFQVPQPFSGLTTYENVLVAAAFGQEISEAEAKDKAIEALELTSLMSKARQLAGSLTLLDRKRLELARSIATAPRLLLLDEIAGGLTETECHELIELIMTIKNNGVSIIWIEHVLHALLSVVDRIMVLDFGQKITEGKPEDVMKSPEVSSIYLGLDEENIDGQ